MSAKLLVQVNELTARVDRLERILDSVMPKIERILEIQRLKGGRPRKDEKYNGKIERRDTGGN